MEISKEYQEELYQEYLRYFKLFAKHAPRSFVEWGGYQEGKPTGMASSFESIIAYAKQIDEKRLKDKCLLNAGSGASSWMFRKLFPTAVCDIEPNQEYMLAVQYICKLGGIDQIGFYGDAAYFFGISSLPDRLIDYVYYDYGNIERIPNMHQCLNAANISMYVDDADDRQDCKELRTFVYELAARAGVKITDCVEAKDEYGRWGVILSKQ